jgi:hypothetical protein
MSKPASTTAPRAISGIEVMRGVGAQEAKGFWADAWERVLKRRGAVLGMVWIGIIAFFAVFAPVIASAHPVMLERLDDKGAVIAREWPMLANLSPTDWLLMIAFAVGTPWVFLGGFNEPARKLGRGGRLGVLVVALLQAGLTIVLAGAIVGWADGSSVAWFKQLARLESGPWPIVAVVSLAIAAVTAIVPTLDSLGARPRLWSAEKYPRNLTRFVPA